MKTLLIIVSALLTSALSWLGSYDEAMQKAKAAHKPVLVSFSGSDWCVPCINLRKEILESEVFERYASESLILLRADFPRQKKNKLSPDQVKMNEALAEKFNPDGKFPYTLLIDENGKVLKTWDGYPKVTPEDFVKQVAKAAAN
ncbi:thioredoxin family protein [Pedobacter sp. JY14-1]|uniref:thioredoxin family protein n=1 Tax=Pedobacter sp. JY14-1 TaxID=3034151 RepID=UPI0023E1121C|nr:thioredoxin family protein [Pedobacter sp. JY14-1]